MSDTCQADVLNATAQSELKAFIERIERQNATIKDEQEARKEIFQELKGRGFDVAATKAIVKLRATDPAKRQEMDAIIDLYAVAVGLA